MAVGVTPESKNIHSQNRVIVFERVGKDKAHDRNGSDTLVFWGRFPSGLCKK